MEIADDRCGGSPDQASPALNDVHAGLTGDHYGRYNGRAKTTRHHLAVSQAMHFEASALLVQSHTEHFHEPEGGGGGAKPGANPVKGLNAGVLAGGAPPGFASSHAAHFAASGLLVMLHVGHVHEPAATGFGPKPEPHMDVEAEEAGAGTAAFGCGAGFGPSQAMHLLASALLVQSQIPHFQDPGGGGGCLKKPQPPDVADAGAAAPVGLLTGDC